VISVKKINQKNFQILIQPNSSLHGWARFFFLLSIFILCGGIAVIFYFVGAIMILPFAGIELTILFIAFYLSFKWSSKKEKIYITQDIVKIEKGITKAEYLWEEFRTFTSFQIQKDINKIIRLSFRSKGKDVFVGDFLNEDDKNKLKDEISIIIQELNSDKSNH
jgi:uncharacterized membrane protein